MGGGRRGEWSRGGGELGRVGWGGQEGGVEQRWW